MKISEKRLSETFIQLCETDSPSGKERKIADKVTEIMEQLAPTEYFRDNSQKQTGSECGNLFFYFQGDTKSEPVFLNCHLDTVEPGRGIKVKQNDSIFTSAGETILGSDDKSGIAAIIEAIRTIKEQHLPHRSVQIIFTTCEETGLLGAKAINPADIKAKFGYALDTTGFGSVILKAPACNSIEIKIKGRSAHAGLNPEEGINSIMLAAEALNEMQQGKIDHETTINFGTIKGGVASNIVAEEVTIVGEIRSHNKEKLNQLSREITSVLQQKEKKWQEKYNSEKGKLPEVRVKITPEFPAMQISRNDPVCQEIKLAADRIEMPLNFISAGGGSDANIFTGYGFPTAIIATGMTNVHTCTETINLNDMAKLTRLIISLLTTD